MKGDTVFDQWGIPVESYDAKDIMSIIAISVGGVIAVIVIVSVIIVYAFSNLKLKKLSVPSKKHKKALARGMKHDDWAQAHGFEFVGFYMIGLNSQNFMCIWRDDVGSRFIAAYVMPTKTTVDYVTIFDQDRALPQPVPKTDCSSRSRPAPMSKHSPACRWTNVGSSTWKWRTT